MSAPTSAFIIYVADIDQYVQESPRGFTARRADATHFESQQAAYDCVDSMAEHFGPRGATWRVVPVTTVTPRIGLTPVKKFVVVYQAGLANLFEVASFVAYGARLPQPKRLFQGDFRTAEALALGIVYAGGRVRYASCNKAGDIAQLKWTPGLSDCPFREQARPKSTAAIEG